MQRLLKKDNKKLYMLGKNTFPSYKGPVFLDYTDSIIIKNTKYVNGTKSMYRLVNIDSEIFLKDFTKEMQVIDVPKDCVIVQYNCVSGLDKELIIHINTAVDIKNTINTFKGLR